MRTNKAISVFLEEKRRANCAAGTISLYRRHLERWQEWLGAPIRNVADLTIDDLRGFFAYLRDDHVAYATEKSSRKPSARPLTENTLASYHRSVRAFWTFLATEELISPEQQRFFLRIHAPAVPKDPRPVTDEDAMQRLVDACGDGHSEESARNRAIAYMLFETGMRIGELCALTDEVVDHKKRQARVLRAKGKKHRAVFWQSGTAAALGRYLLLRRGKPGGPLFRGCSIRNNGGQVTTDLVRATMKRIATQAGFKLPKGAPLHSLRHGFAHAALENGAQITDLADLLGHEDLETTRIYLRNDDTRLADAYDRIFRRSRRERLRRDDAERGG
jgi:site-specific recombinase XerD